MLKKQCRLCFQNLFEKPLLTLNGMPKAAQHFLLEKEFPNDEGINLDIFQCASCGLVQLNIEPSQSTFQEYISKKYYMLLLFSKRQKI